MTMITFPELKEAEGRLNAKRKELADLFSEAKNDKGELDASKVKGYTNGTDLAATVRSLNDEIDDLAVKAEDLRAIARGAALAEERDENEAGDTSTKARNDDEEPPVKSIGELFVESKAGTELKGKTVELPGVELKTLFERGAGWSPFAVRGPRLVLDEQRPVQLVDVLPQTRTDQSAVKYMEETTFTNNAAETAEGAAKPEAALALTERTATVEKIAVWLPVTDEQLEDEPRVQDYLNNRLPFMVRQRLDGQLIAGNGTTPNIRGVLNASGLQTQAKGADPTPDAIYKAMTKVRVTGQAMPDLAVFHPNDWQDVRLLRTADGIYIWGNPSEAGPERIWGLRVIQVQAATENTAVVGDFGNFSELVVRSGMTIKVSDSHSTYFVENKQAVRAEIRVAAVWYRGTAFCQVTGI